MTSFAIEQTEAAFQSAVQDLADLRGWEWLHLQRALNDRGYWRTPVTGPLGPGWPDLLMIRGDRVIVAELKVGYGKLRPNQERVLGIISSVGWIEVYTWHPKDWDEIEGILK